MVIPSLYVFWSLAIVGVPLHEGIAVLKLRVYHRLRCRVVLYLFGYPRLAAVLVGEIFVALSLKAIGQRMPVFPPFVTLRLVVILYPLLLRLFYFAFEELAEKLQVVYRAMLFFASVVLRVLRAELTPYVERLHVLHMILVVVIVVAGVFQIKYYNEVGSIFSSATVLMFLF